MMNQRALRIGEELLSDHRERASTAKQARVTVSHCIEIFNAVDEVERHLGVQLDDALFNASFDLGQSVFRFRLSERDVASLIASIETLYFRYYRRSPGSVSCNQFWDNVLGYKNVDKEAEPSADLFFRGARELLRSLSNNPEEHIRASALHGMNHFPDIEIAKRELEQAVAREKTPILKDYAAKALEALRRGDRLV